MSPHVEVVEIPEVPYGPEGEPRIVDANYYREAARNIRYQAGRGNAFAGTNLTETVAKLCVAAAEALERPAFQTFVQDDQPCPHCGGDPLRQDFARGSGCHVPFKASPNIDPERSSE